MSDDRDFVVLPRDALFEFFGEVALTPWAADADCAPKAQYITEWVAHHDLSNVYLAGSRGDASNETDARPESPESRLWTLQEFTDAVEGWAEIGVVPVDAKAVYAILRAAVDERESLRVAASILQKLVATADIDWDASTFAGAMDDFTDTEIGYLLDALAAAAVVDGTGGEDGEI